MSTKISVGSIVRCTRGSKKFFKTGDVGTVVGFDGDSVEVNFNGRGNYVVRGDGVWWVHPTRLEVIAKQKGFTPRSHAVELELAQQYHGKSGHSSVHAGLQEHSVGGCYPLAVVTYGHDPAIHTVENLTTGCVAGYVNLLGERKVRQWPRVGSALAYMEALHNEVSTGMFEQVWLSGRPVNVGGSLVIPDTQHGHSYTLARRERALAEGLGRSLTPFEVYQLACELDNA